MGKTLKNYASWRLSESMHEYTFYKKRFERLLLTMFDWKNLPDGISTRFLESTLYHDGMIVFHKDKGGFFRVTKGTASGSLNAYDEPIMYHLIDSTGFSGIVKANDCVPIWNDFFREGNVRNVNFFAKRLSNIEKTIDMNLEQLKQPVVISCPEGQLLTAKQLWQKKTNGEPIIFTKNSVMDNIDTSVMDLHVTNHIPDLQDTKHEYMNEALTFFGINNVNVVKKERLVTGEAEQNDEQIWLNMNAMYKARKDACEQINEKFGLEVDVEIAKERISAQIGELHGDSSRVDEE